MLRDAVAHTKFKLRQLAGALHEDKGKSSLEAEKFDDLRYVIKLLDVCILLDEHDGTFRKHHDLLKRATEAAITKWYDMLVDSLAKDDMKAAQRALDAVQGALVLGQLVESGNGTTAQVHEKMRYHFEEKTNSFCDKVRELLGGEEFEALAKLFNGQEDLNTAQQREDLRKMKELVSGNVKIKHDECMHILNTMRAQRKPNTTEINKLREHMEWFGRASPLRTALHAKFDSRYKPLAIGIRDQIDKTTTATLNHLKKWRFVDARAGMDIIEQFVRFPPSISAHAKAESTKLEQKLCEKIEALKPDLQRAFDIARSGNGGSYEILDTICDEVKKAEESECEIPITKADLRATLERNLNGMVTDIQKMISHFEIKKATRSLENLRGIMRAAIAKEALFKDECSTLGRELGAAKEDLFDRGLTISKENITKGLDEFKEVVSVEYRHRKDHFLAKAESNVTDAVDLLTSSRRGDRSTRRKVEEQLKQLGRFASLLSEHAGGEIAAAFKRMQTTLVQRCLDQISEACSRASKDKRAGRWEEVSAGSDFVNEYISLVKSLPALADLKGERKADFDLVLKAASELTEALESKGQALIDGIEKIDALEFDAEDGVSAEDLSCLLNLLGSDKKIATVVGLDIRHESRVSYENASLILEGKVEGVESLMTELWDCCKFKGINTTLSNLAELQKIRDEKFRVKISSSRKNAVEQVRHPLPPYGM